MKAFPEVTDFIETKAKDYGNLEVVYKRGQAPQLVMVTDNEDQEDEVISINNWKADYIVDFLKEKLSAPDA